MDDKIKKLAGFSGFFSFMLVVTAKVGTPFASGMLWEYTRAMLKDGAYDRHFVVLLLSVGPFVKAGRWSGDFSSKWEEVCVRYTRGFTIVLVSYPFLSFLLPLQPGAGYVMLLDFLVISGFTGICFICGLCVRKQVCLEIPPTPYKGE